MYDFRSFVFADSKGYFRLGVIQVDPHGVHNVIIETSGIVIDREDPEIEKSGGLYNFKLQVCFKISLHFCISQSLVHCVVHHVHWFTASHFSLIQATEVVDGVENGEMAVATVNIIITDDDDQLPEFNGDHFSISVPEDIPENSAIPGLNMVVNDNDVVS